MGDIINLNRYRKQREKKETEARAFHNREEFGRTKPERMRDKAAEERKRNDLDKKRLD